METVRWRDISRYCKDDKDRVPYRFQIQAADGVFVIVTRWVHGDPMRWYLICRAAACNIHMELSNLDLEDAKREALGHVHELLIKRAQTVEKLMRQTP
jgi:hypothetical protein